MGGYFEGEGVFRGGGSKFQQNIFIIVNAYYLLRTTGLSQPLNKSFLIGWGITDY